MVIKSKDGGIYKLRGPNPLMESQSDWDKSKLKLINMGRHSSEVVPQDKKPKVNIPIAPKTKAVPASKFLQEAQEEPTQTPALTTPPNPPPPTTPSQPPPTSTPPAPVVLKEQLEIPEDVRKLFDVKGEKYFCAPAIGTKTHLDSLYGDTYQTIQYGDKYLFDALILDQTDLELSFWCVRQITVNSIVYRKVQGGGERWWRVRSVDPKTGGYLVTSIPSDSNPDFS